MEKSLSITELAKALTKFQSAVESVSKDATNPFFKSKYATLENIVKTIKKPLADAGLSFSQFPSGENELVTILMHTSGEWIQSSVKMSPKDSSPQSQGSAITYMRRYSLSSVLGLATDEDDDGNAASTAKTVSKPVPKPVAKDWKQKVKEACDDQDPLLETKEDYEKFVMEKTGFELREENSEAILSVLKK